MTDTLAHQITGAGDPIVFLHGITADRRHWGPVVERLDECFRCVNVDLLGHGASPRPGGYDLFTQAEAVGALVGDLGLDRPLVVGHSFGGFIATILGTTAPVRGVVNVDQELDTAAFQRRIRPFEERLRGDDFTAAFLQFADTLRPELVPDDFGLLSTLDPDPEVVLDVWGQVFDTPAADLTALVEPALAAYSVPYLAVFGQRISDEERRLQHLIPGAIVEEWEGLGHFVQLVDPDRTAQRITAFADST